MQPPLPDQHDKDTCSTKLFFEIDGELVACLNPLNVQEYTVLAKSPLQQAREMICRPSGIHSPVIDENDALAGFRCFFHCRQPLQRKFLKSVIHIQNSKLEKM